MADDILDAKNILFCFGTVLSYAGVFSVRPRSIGVAEKTNWLIVQHRRLIADGLSNQNMNLEKTMKVGVTSQNFRTVTGHAGKTRRFLVYESSQAEIQELERLDLPKEMSMHEFRGDSHPLDELDVLITASCGQGFVRRMAAKGVRVIATGEADPMAAVSNVVAGNPLPPPLPHEH